MLYEVITSTFALLTETAFALSSRRASPFEARNPVFADNPSIIPTPSSKSAFEIVALGTPSNYKDKITPLRSHIGPSAYIDRNNFV